jgi:hypothetical protein
VQSTGIQATRKTLIVTGGASITLDITKSAVEPTGRLVDDEATIVTVAAGMTPHTTVLESIKEANPNCARPVDPSSQFQAPASRARSSTVPIKNSFTK